MKDVHNRCKKWIEEQFQHGRTEISQIIAEVIKRFNLDKGLVTRIVSEMLYEGRLM